MGQENHPKLDDLLRSARVPERTEGYWQRFPQRITRLVRERARTRQEVTVPGFYWWLAISTACLALGVGVVVWKKVAPSTSGENTELARSEKLYHEIAPLFPDRLQAVVLDGPDVNVVLSDQANVATSPPLFVKICGGARCRSVVTFSGQRVRVNGETLDVLADASGNVIVAGRHFAWSSASGKQRAGNYRIEAQRLGARS